MSGEKSIYLRSSKLSGEVEAEQWACDSRIMSLMTDWQKKLPPHVKIGELLDYCPRCTRLQAVGKRTAFGNGYSESYTCRACGFRFTKKYVEESEVGGNDSNRRI